MPRVFAEGHGCEARQTFPPAAAWAPGFATPRPSSPPPPTHPPTHTHTHTLLCAGVSVSTWLPSSEPSQPETCLCRAALPLRRRAGCPLPALWTHPARSFHPLRTQTGNRPQSGQHLKPHLVDTIKDKSAHLGLRAPEPASSRKPGTGRQGEGGRGPNRPSDRAARFLMEMVATGRAPQPGSRPRPPGPRSPSRLRGPGRGAPFRPAGPRLALNIHRDRYFLKGEPTARESSQPSVGTKEGLAAACSGSGRRTPFRGGARAGDIRRSLRDGRA